MICHVKEDFEKEISFNRFDIKSIMFLSKILTNAKIRYWSTELKMIEIVWIIKKIRHLIESSRKQFTIIFIDHFALTEIIKQTSLNTFNIDKLNLKLVRTFQYLSILSIDIKIKLKKFHVISNALSRLFSITNNDQSRNFEKSDAFEDLQYDLDAMIVQSINEFKTSFFDVHSVYISDYLNVYFEQDKFLIEMTNDYRKSLLNVYDSNSQWSKLKHKLERRQDLENISNDIDTFLRKNMIYYSSKDKISRLCISWSLKRNIYQMTHDDNHHCEFHRAYVRVFESIYIRHMIKRLRRYIHHCKFCLEDQIKRHSSYDELNSIRTMTLSFHTMIIDFVIALSEVSSEENVLLTTIDTFIKRVSLIFDKNTWIASNWAFVWLDALQKEEWKLLKAIIFDRDSKFVKFFWKIIFQHFDVAFHFTTVYHSFFDD
jgi:hypothetical protein